MKATKEPTKYVENVENTPEKLNGTARKTKIMKAVKYYVNKSARAHSKIEFFHILKQK